MLSDCFHRRGWRHPCRSAAMPAGVWSAAASVPDLPGPVVDHSDLLLWLCLPPPACPSPLPGVPACSRTARRSGSRARWRRRAAPGATWRGCQRQASHQVRGQEGFSKRESPSCCCCRAAATAVAGAAVTNALHKTRPPTVLLLFPPACPHPRPCRAGAADPAGQGRRAGGTDWAHRRQPAGGGGHAPCTRPGQPSDPACGTAPDLFLGPAVVTSNLQTICGAIRTRTARSALPPSKVCTPAPPPPVMPPAILSSMLSCRAFLQVTWIGYPNSTGLGSVGYRLTDAICDPESTQQTFTGAPHAHWGAAAAAVGAAPDGQGFSMLSEKPC